MRPTLDVRGQTACHSLLVLWVAVQSSWRLPATIEALQDVPAHVETAGGQKRGVLYVGRNETFLVKAGQRFRMVKIYAEGSCRIEFEGRQYDVSSCPWLDGFTDQQTDVFRVVSGRRTKSGYVRLPDVPYPAAIGPMRSAALKPCSTDTPSRLAPTSS